MKSMCLRMGEEYQSHNTRPNDFYAVTAFALTLDEAAKKATRFMIDYLVEVHGLERHEANMLCSYCLQI